MKLQRERHETVCSVWSSCDCTISSSHEEESLILHSCWIRTHFCVSSMLVSQDSGVNLQFTAASMVQVYFIMSLRLTVRRHCVSDKLDDSRDTSSAHPSALFMQLCNFFFFASVTNTFLRVCVCVNVIKNGLQWKKQKQSEGEMIDEIMIYHLFSLKDTHRKNLHLLQLRVPRVTNIDTYSDGV